MQQGSTDLGRASELVDVLMRSSLPFREQLLGGGPWQVRGPWGTSRVACRCCTSRVHLS